MNNKDQIKTSVKVPFLPSTCMQSHVIQIAETEYANPENEKDVLKLYICIPNISFNEHKLKEKFSGLNTDKVNFVNDVKSFVLAHSVESLRKKVHDHHGVLRFKLNDQHVELTYKEDFFLSALEFLESHNKQQ